MTRRVLVPIINYGYAAFIDQCCNVLMPLVLATSIPYGGLGMDSFTIGFFMSTLGIVIGVSSATLFPTLERKIGIYRMYRVCYPFYFVLIACFPIMNLLARRAGGVDGFVWAILVVIVGCYSVLCMNYSTYWILC